MERRAAGGPDARLVQARPPAQCGILLISAPKTLHMLHVVMLLISRLRIGNNYAGIPLTRIGSFNICVRVSMQPPPKCERLRSGLPCCLFFAFSPSPPKGPGRIPRQDLGVWRPLLAFPPEDQRPSAGGQIPQLERSLMKNNCTGRRTSLCIFSAPAPYFILPWHCCIP